MVAGRGMGGKGGGGCEEGGRGVGCGRVAAAVGVGPHCEVDVACH